MKYVEKKGFKLPVFSLGTVQLGCDYGLGEFREKPDAAYAFSLLDRALDQGVNLLDTANNYGESEKVIGHWLKTLDMKNRPLIVTKIGPFDHSSEEALRADIRRQTQKCMEDLGVLQIDILMVHIYKDFEKNPITIKQVFDEMKAEGLIHCTGISLYSEHDYKEVAKAGFDAVQIPINIFDWRQINNGGIQALEDAGAIVFARSVFLQGLIFLERSEIDSRMDFCLPYVDAFHSLCKEFNMNPAVLATSFVLSIPGISSLVLGCQRIEQLDENCALMEKTRLLTSEEMEKIRATFSDVDPRLLDPRCWFNHR